MFKRTLATVCKTAKILSEVNLIGRDYIQPRNLTPQELKSLLWTANDLRCSHKQRNLNVTGTNGTRVTLLTDEPCMQAQLHAHNAAQVLGASLSVIVDCGWKKNMFLEDVGRTLCLSSDVVFCHVKEQNAIEDVANGSGVSVVAVRSGDYSLVRALADIMTIQLHFGYLKHLTVALVGLTPSYLNTYLELLPRLGMNIRYIPISNKMCPKFLERVRKCTQQYNTELHECCQASDTLYRSDVIVTSANNRPELRITLKDVKEAAVNWILLHELPRGRCEIEKELFANPNCLVWQSLENCQWIFAALIMRLRCDYSHATEPPNFEDNQEHILIKI